VPAGAARTGAVATIGAVVERRLLVLGAGPAQVGLLAAARRRGLTVLAADRDPAAAGFRYAERRAIVSVEDEPGLERLARAERVAGIVAPGSDRTPPVAARIAAKLGLPHPLRPVTAHRLAARQREREALAAAGVDIPRARVCNSLHRVRAAAEELGLPCTVTAVDRPAGTGSRVASISGLAETVAAATSDSRVAACLVEEAPAKELLVAGFVLAGIFRPLLVAAAAADGLQWPPAAPADAVRAAVSSAERAAAAVGIESGPCEVRVAARGSGVCVVSVAARLGRFHEPELCRAASGVDLNALALKAAFGEPIASGDLVPRPRVAAAVVRLLPRADAILGVEAAFAVPGVEGIRTYRGRDRGGAILATGADRDAAAAAAERAASLLRFVSADAQAVA